MPPSCGQSRTERADTIISRSRLEVMEKKSKANAVPPQAAEHRRTCLYVAGPRVSWLVAEYAAASAPPPPGPAPKAAPSRVATGEAWPFVEDEVSMNSESSDASSDSEKPQATEAVPAPAEASHGPSQPPALPPDSGVVHPPGFPAEEPNSPSSASSSSSASPPPPAHDELMQRFSSLGPRASPPGDAASWTHALRHSEAAPPPRTPEPQPELPAWARPPGGSSSHQRSPPRLAEPPREGREVGLSPSSAAVWFAVAREQGEVTNFGIEGILDYATKPNLQCGGGTCTVGLRKVHVRQDPQCRQHGVTSKSNVPIARAKKQSGEVTQSSRTKQPGEKAESSRANSIRPLSEMTGFKTRGGLMLLYDPRPEDEWINRPIVPIRGGWNVTSTGEILNKTQAQAYGKFLRRHRGRNKVGDTADKLVRMVDKYLPLQADETLAYVCDSLGKRRTTAPFGGEAPITTAKKLVTKSGRGDLLEGPLMGEEAQVSSRSDQTSRWETHPSDKGPTLSMTAGEEAITVEVEDDVNLLENNEVADVGRKYGHCAPSKQKDAGEWLPDPPWEKGDTTTSSPTTTRPGDAQQPRGRSSLVASRNIFYTEIGSHQNASGGAMLRFLLGPWSKTALLAIGAAALAGIAGRHLRHRATDLLRGWGPDLTDLQVGEAKAGAMHLLEVTRLCLHPMALAQCHERGVARASAAHGPAKG
ncbi:hypothetical protein AK812_SmicGene32889 [Symbiodinium microadriaticum]|uniref:Uncharacterized protein n=1 Tax=Symbiodinium microadriaticum TaxID=2951 RepID=A0A1Q9CSY3_SYMMI|nr:hypothetical protein AK812_SmicGene32889 [Symbiodinium microadriaticum]